MKFAQKINKKLFDIFLLFTRDPFVHFFSEELEFYSSPNGRLIGLISLDLTDNDFYAAIMSRDESRQYRAETIQANIETIDAAREWIDKNMENNRIVLHNNESGFFDLFQVNTPQKQLSPLFTLLNESVGLMAAKEVIKEISYHYKDIDGNFIEQFQSVNGFDARLWELYLFCLCREEYFYFQRNSYAPDFMIEKLGTEIAIEAVIISRKNHSLKDIKSKAEVEAELLNEMPLRFGSSLFDKLRKKYWELPHVRGKPFLIAIADFHEDMSMTWSFPALTDYLYGFRYKHHHDVGGKLIVEPVQIAAFEKKTGAVIPAGFFFQPDAENVSAIIFSSTATIGKFNRMGKQAGLGSPDAQIFRFGICHNFEEHASKPNTFFYEVTDNGAEVWSEGVSIFHNPNALIPLDRSLFPSVAHHILVGKELRSYFPAFFPYSSINNTIVTIPPKDQN